MLLINSSFTSIAGEPEGLGEVSAAPPLMDRFSEHPWCDTDHCWKNVLNKLQLILQPYVSYCPLLPWVFLFHIPSLHTGFAALTGMLNLFHVTLPT